jgi:DNA polymerase-3 subunit alpha
MRGVGEGAVAAIVESRQTGDLFKSIFDFARRVNPKDVNKRVYEALARGGALDCFHGLHRAQYFAPDEKGRTLVELAARYGQGMQQQAESAQVSLFGGDDEVAIPEPAIPTCEPWERMHQLNLEKEIIGIYISGHPLDAFKLEVDHLCYPKEGLQVLAKADSVKGRELRFAGRVVAPEHRMTKNGKPFGRFSLEDYHHTETFMLFGEDYLKLKDYLVEGWFVFVRGAVEPRRFGPEDSLEFKIRGMELLADVREKMIERIRLQVSLAGLTEDFANEMADWVERHPGKVGLTMEIRDEDAGIEMTSRTKKIELTNEFIQVMEGWVSEGRMAYRLETKR